MQLVNVVQYCFDPKITLSYVKEHRSGDRLTTIMRDRVAMRNTEAAFYTVLTSKLQVFTCLDSTVCHINSRDTFCSIAYEPESKTGLQYLLEPTESEDAVSNPQLEDLQTTEVLSSSFDLSESADPRVVLEELFRLLEEYAPAWYTEEHHHRIVGALTMPIRGRHEAHFENIAE